MSAYSLSVADALFAGKGLDHQISRRSDHFQRPGVRVHLPTLVDLGTPAAADDDLLIDDATSTELPNAATKTYTAANDGASPFDNADTPAVVTLRLPDGATAQVWPLDVPRNVVGVCTHATSVVGMTVLVRGYDEYKRTMSELLTFGATGTSKTATGGKAFAYISGFSIVSAGNATANTLKLGTGVKLGLPYRLEQAGHVLSASIGGVQELVNVASNATVVAAVATSPATTTTGDVRGTVAFNTAPDGSKRALVWMLVEGRNSARGIAGVGQA